MKIKDCIKGFNRGISKVLPPEQTFKVVLRKLKNMDSPILKGYFKVLQPSKIPQYAFIGTDYYRRIIGTIMLVSRTTVANGKGHFKEQAKASGLMELVERYSCAKYIRSNRNVTKIYSFKDSKNNLFQLEDLYANLIDEAQERILKDEDLEVAKIRWYDGYSLNGRKVYLPISLIIYLLEGTNGMAAGNSLEEALLHAICEVIERHCLSRIEINKLKTPLIDPATVNSPIARKLIKKFQSLKYPIFIKDFSLGIGLPVIGVVRKVDKNNCIITAGVATTREEALIRALTENSQGEDKQNFKKVSLFKHYFVNDKILSFKDTLNVDNKNMKLELENIEEILNKQNMKVFYINTTDKLLNIPSVIVYISGAKTIYYHKEITNQNIIKLLIGVCLDTENYSDLEKYLKKAIKNNYMDQTEYFYFKGIVLKRHLQYKKAIECLLKVANSEVNERSAIEKAELRIKSFMNLGLCYQAINDISAAVDYYLKVIDLGPDFSIEDLQFYYDNIRSLSNDKSLFKNAKNLYQNIKLLRTRFPKVPSDKFRAIFLSIPQKNLC
jgi:ribosomal protein S12 methylthiotransferase accessory factor